VHSNISLSVPSLIPDEIIERAVTSSNDRGFRYTVFGLLFESNLPLAGLMPASLSCASESQAKSPDIKIHLGSLPESDSSNSESRLRYVSSYLDETGEPALFIWGIDGGRFLRMSYTDGTEFWVNRGFSTLWGNWSDKSSLENTLSYLVGPVLGLLLRLRGKICLHASAVAFNDKSIVFVGRAGAGKSTTAAAFARKGFAVLSDDIVALVDKENIFHVVPAYPRLSLWPDSVKLLYGSPDALPPIMPDWNKRCLMLGQDGAPPFEGRTLPIGAIYFFGDPAVEAESCFEVISQREALLTLVANSYAAKFLDGKQRAEEFAVLSQLASVVPTRKINPRRYTMDLNTLCGAICRDFDAIDPSNH
jgi:hypothetical protein